ISSCFPFAKDTISSFCQEALMVVVHWKFFFVMFTVLSVISIPWLPVCPIFCNVVLKPVIVGILRDINKSLVFDLYRSITPEIRLLNKVKSIPRLYCVVFSHPRSGLAKTEDGRDPAVIVVTKG